MEQLANRQQPNFKHSSHTLAYAHFNAQCHGISRLIHPLLMFSMEIARFYLFPSPILTLFIRRFISKFFTSIFLTFLITLPLHYFGDFQHQRKKKINFFYR